MAVLGRLTRLLGRSGPSQPTLSIVVPFYDAEAFFEEALSSLRTQTLSDIQVVLVDDGSTDGSARIAAAAATADPRIVVVRQPHRGPGAARNAGLGRATGRYVTFMDADDVVPVDAYEKMVRSLERSGSDFVIGVVRRFHAARTWTPGWVRTAHTSPAEGATLETFPDAILDILACNRLYRRDFWDRHVGGFPEGVVYEDHVPMLRAFLHGARFDILTDTTYLWRQNVSGTSQQKADLRNLTDRVHAKAEAWRLLTDEATSHEKALWLSRVLDLDLPLFHPLALDASDEYRDILRQTVAAYLELARSSGALERVSGPHRLAAWYVAHGDWEALTRLREAADGPVLAHLDDGRPLLPQHPFPSRAPCLPDEMREVGAHESRLTVRLLRARWTADGALDVELVSRLHGVHVEPADATCTVIARAADRGAWRNKASIDETVRLSSARPPRGTVLGLRASIALPAPASTRDAPPAVDLVVEVRAGAFVRSAPVVVAAGSAAAARPSTLRPGPPVHVAALTTAGEEQAGGTGLRFVLAPVVLVSAAQHGGQVVIQVRSTAGHVTGLRARDGQRHTLAEADGAGWRLPVPASGSWLIEAQTDGRWVRVRADDATTRALRPPFRPGPRSTVRISASGAPALVAARMTAAGLVLEVLSPAGQPEPDVLVPADRLLTELLRAESVERNPRDAAPTIALEDGVGRALAVGPPLAQELPVVTSHAGLTCEIVVRRGTAQAVVRRLERRP